MSKKTETMLTGRRIMRALLSLCALLLVAEASATSSSAHRLSKARMMRRPVSIVSVFLLISAPEIQNEHIDREEQRH